MQFKRIGNRLLIAVGGVVLLGIMALVGLNVSRQEKALIGEVEASLARVSDSVAEGLSALMLGGHADVAPEFAARLKNVPNITDYRILRVDGAEAFVDNSSVEKVNERLGQFEFTPRKGNPQATQVLAATDPDLLRVRSTGQRVFTYERLPGGDRQVKVLAPIRSQDRCEKCHEGQDAVRGIVKLTVSLADVDRDIGRTGQLSLAIIVATLAGIVVLVYWIAQKTVVSQIVQFSRAMETAATGDMTVRLPATRRDEIGHMARSFNQMNDELLGIYSGLKEERNKLNTIIQGANSGIIITDAAQQIVLVNRAAEQMLGKDEKTLIERGFLDILDDPAWMVEQLGRSSGGAVVVERGGRTLSVQASTIRRDDNTPIGSAALLRDITEEKRLEAILKEQSITDALTGLHNRRHFDEVLNTEFKRWRRYRQPLSVAMLDVDHFKRFNDTHGHECGDRVLEAIGGVLRSLDAPGVVPCRYGGEEMVLVMPGMREDGALHLAESVRARIADLVIDGLRVTVSIGVAGCPGHSVDDGEGLVKLADQALYEAKHGGRNQVRAAPADPA